MSRELRLRIISAVILAVLVLAAAWRGGYWFSALAILIGLLIFYEWTTITKIAATDRFGASFGWIALAFVAFDGVLHSAVIGLLLLCGFSAVALALSLIRKRSVWLAGGIFYAGLSLLSLNFLRNGFPDGLAAIIFIFAVVWATDILAYFVGRAIGGPKLAPRISPGKTWSGAIGGTVSGVVAGLLAVHFVGEPITFVTALFCAILSIASQIGDLFESWIKRRFGVKDSSHLIPGHGGVMDRVDGLVFACFVAFFSILAVGAASAGLLSMVAR